MKSVTTWVIPSMFNLRYTRAMIPVIPSAYNGIISWSQDKQSKNSEGIIRPPASTSDLCKQRDFLIRDFPFSDYTFSVDF